MITAFSCGFLMCPCQYNLLFNTTPKWHVKPCWLKKAVKDRWKLLLGVYCV